jgi:hypothetical protein
VPLLTAGRCDRACKNGSNGDLPVGRQAGVTAQYSGTGYQMKRNKLKIAIENGNIEWQRHAFERMMEREISREVVKKVDLRVTKRVKTSWRYSDHPYYLPLAKGKH